MEDEGELRRRAAETVMKLVLSLGVVYVVGRQHVKCDPGRAAKWLHNRSTELAQAASARAMEADGIVGRR